MAMMIRVQQALRSALARLSRRPSPTGDQRVDDAYKRLAPLFAKIESRLNDPSLSEDERCQLALRITARLHGATASRLARRHATSPAQADDSEYWGIVVCECIQPTAERGAEPVERLQPLPPLPVRRRRDLH